jgi:NAD(P)-dependent dehydrogenase (short-subunit alcohol dehydrogenase family)
MARGWTENDIGDLSGKTFVVTGANSGIGFEAARALAGKGGLVVLACRSVDKGKEAADRIRAAHPAAATEVRALDLASLASVRTFAGEVARDHARLDGLVNNAGIMAIPRRETADGFEMQIGTNHLGHFALTGLLLGRLLGSAPSRVVTVSSMMHTRGKFGALDAEDLRLAAGYAKWEAYGRSKLANLLFAYELQRRLEIAHPQVLSLACHPGYAATNLQHVGPAMAGSAVEGFVMRTGNALFAQSARAGALPTLCAAVGADVRGGDFIGPGGPFTMWGKPVAQRSSRASRDLYAAKKLWETSEQLTGVRYAF